MNKNRLSIGIVLSLSGTLVLTGCSTGQFNKAAGTVCVDTSKVAVKAYSLATTPTAQKVSGGAIDTAMSAASTVANLFSDGKPGVAANIKKEIAILKANKVSQTTAKVSVETLKKNKTTVTNALIKLGQLCSETINKVNK